MIELSGEEREKFIQLCHAAQAAARIGQRETAHLYFRQAIQIHPFSAKVWLELAKVVDNEADRQVALENVLTLNPQHEEARRLLNSPKSSGT